MPILSPLPLYILNAAFNVPSENDLGNTDVDMSELSQKNVLVKKQEEDRGSESKISG